MNNLFSYGRQLLYTAALFTSCCFVVACENSDKAIRDYTKKVVMTEEARDIESYMSQDGNIRAKLKAPLMYRVSADTLYVEFPKSLHCDFYNDSMKVETWLDSKYGKYFETMNKVYLRDSVRVISAKQDTLWAQDMWWDQNTRMFYTEKYAVYHGPNKAINGGTGMTATQDLSSIIFNHPTGTVKMPENGFEKQDSTPPPVPARPVLQQQ